MSYGEALLNNASIRMSGKEIIMTQGDLKVKKIMDTARSQLRHSKLDKQSSRRAKPKLSADYVVGLTDGEGCFYIRGSSFARRTA